MSGGPDASAPSLLASFGSGLTIATLGAAAAVLPAALRSAGDVALAPGWLVLWSSLALVVAPAAGALRLARPLPRPAWSLPLALALALAPLVVLGRVLKVSTHHRPLGGATFAIVAVLLVLGAWAFAARALAWSARRDGAVARVAPWLVGLAGAGLGALVALPALRSPLGAFVLDGVLAAVVLGVGAFAPVPEKLAERARVAGLGVWLVVVLVGLVLPVSRAALYDHAPALMAFATWLR